MGNEEDKIKEEKIKKIKIIKERDHETKTLELYLSIKNFLVDYIYGNKILPEKGLDIYIVKTYSIPEFIRILKEQFKEIKDEEELKNAEINLKKELIKYQFEQTLEIYDSYSQYLDIMKNEVNNEFIIVNENFVKNFGNNENLGKKVSLIQIDKIKHIIKIKFPASDMEIYLEEINEQKGYFKFLKEIEEPKSENSTIIIKNRIDSNSSSQIYKSIFPFQSYISGNNDNSNIDKSSKSSIYYEGINKSEIEKNNQQRIKEELNDSIIESIIYCLLNIKSFNEQFMNNGNNIQQDKIISKLFYNLIIQKFNKNYIFNCSDLIREIKLKYKSEPNFGVDNIYNILHNELKYNSNQKSAFILQSSLNIEPKIEIQNACNIFIKNGISIMLDIFYFQNIITFICNNCNEKLLYKSYINNHIIFPLISVYNYKNSPEKLHLSDCFDFLTQNKMQNGISCKNCLNKNNLTYSFYRIVSINNILTIILDRGKDFQDHDIFFNLDINAKQDLTKYFFNGNIKQYFELIGFCSFYKDKNRCIPFFKNYEDNGWYYLDNSEINSAIKASDVGSPFLLFYQKMK